MLSPHQAPYSGLPRTVEKRINEGHLAEVLGRRARGIGRTGLPRLDCPAQLRNPAPSGTDVSDQVFGGPGSISLFSKRERSGEVVRLLLRSIGRAGEGQLCCVCFLIDSTSSPAISPDCSSLPSLC